MSKLCWLHYEKALPVMASIDIPKAMVLYEQFSRGMAVFKSMETEPALSEVLTTLGPDFLESVMALIRSLDLNAVRKLAYIAAASIDDLEEAETNPAKENEMLSRVARMEPSEVIALVLFFIGMRTNANPSAPGFSASVTPESDGTAPGPQTSGSSAAR